MIDNRLLVAPFVPEVFDGDTFLYTELLDRRKRSGNNRGRIVRTYYHRDRADFLDQCEQIAQLCEAAQVRAYTRLQPRSFKLVGKAYVKIILEAALSDNWQGMRHAYSKACGTTPPLEKLWLFDCDTAAERESVLAVLPGEFLVAELPSRKGCHLIAKPFNLAKLVPWFNTTGVQIHRDNPTNLYIPDGAA